MDSPITMPQSVPHRGHTNRKAIEELPNHYTHMQLVAERLHVDEEADHDTRQANPFGH
jgi:hypothetical protein